METKPDDAARRRSETRVEAFPSSQSENASGRDSFGGFIAACLAVLLATVGSMLAAAALALVAEAIMLAVEAAPGWQSGGAVAGWTKLLAIAVFLATYVVIAIGKLPGYQLDRAGAALVGASLMVGLGVVTLEQAYHSTDFDAITLLLGMMIVVANLRLSGFFRLVSNWIVMRASHPLQLLLAIVFVSGLFSAFLVNDTVCLIMIRLPADYFGLAIFGHQWKPARLLMTSRSFASAAHLSPMITSSSLIVSRCLLTMGSSTSAHKVSAGCSSGV